MFAIEDIYVLVNASSLHKCPSTQKEGENFERARLRGITYFLTQTFDRFGLGFEGLGALGSTSTQSSSTICTDRTTYTCMHAGR